jgi:diketogulonate reductase-like aldo/keto reductase
MQDHHIVPIAYSPLGRLGSKMGPVADDMTQDPIIQELAQKHGCSASQIILSWGLSRGYVVIPKAVQAAHQEENFKALDIVLTQEEVDKVTTKLDVGKQLFKHTPDTKYNVYA